MIHSARPAPEGSLVELRRGEHAIVARVVWRDGARLGLQSDERLPIEEIMSLTQSHALRLTASGGRIVDRRKHPRFAANDSRIRGRMIEFLGVVTITASLAISAWVMAEEAFAKPMAVVQRAFDGS